jgi:hypothetical protein
MSQSSYEQINSTLARDPMSDAISQLYFEDSLTDQIHAQAPYAAKGQRTQRNNRDGIFREGGEQLMLQLTQDAQGYVGTFDIGLQIT